VIEILRRWFVRLEKDETINDSFRIGLVRLRARLASRLKHEQWQAFGLPLLTSTARDSHYSMMLTGSGSPTCKPTCSPNPG